MAEDSEHECRICRDPTGPLIAPCACSGTIKYCHLECLLEWLSHSQTERLRSKPRCGVCMQPFKLRARGPLVYMLHRLRGLGNASRRFAPKVCDHVLQQRCSHLHCMCVRVLVVVGVLQLCLWQAQVCMLVAYGCLCALLLLDAMLDELLVPAALLPMLHAALPPVCEVRHRTLSLVTVQPMSRRFSTIPSRQFRGDGRTFNQKQPPAAKRGGGGGAAEPVHAEGDAAGTFPTPGWHQQWQQGRRGERGGSLPLHQRVGSAIASMVRRVASGATRVAHSVVPRPRPAFVGKSLDEAGAAVAEPTAALGMMRSIISLLLSTLVPPLANSSSFVASLEGFARLAGSAQLRRCYLGVGAGAPSMVGVVGGGARDAGGGRPADEAAAQLLSQERGIASIFGCESGDHVCLSQHAAVLAAHAAATGLASSAPAAARLATIPASQLAGGPPWVRAMDPRFYASAYASGRAHEGMPDGTFEWRSLLPIDGDVLVLSVLMLGLNLMGLAYVLGAYQRPLLLRAEHGLRRFVAALEPADIEAPMFEDLVHSFLQLGCAAYAGRVGLARAGLLAHDTYPLDFGSGAGLALHVSIGLLTSGVWSGACEAMQAVQHDFAKWRWSADGVRQSD